MEALLALKRASAPMNFKSFKNLEVGEYVTRKFMKVKTKYGPRVRVHIEDFYIYLPERHATELDDTLIEQLNNNLTMMKYMGKDEENQNRLLIDFEIIQADKNGHMTSNTVTTDKQN